MSKYTAERGGPSPWKWFGPEALVSQALMPAQTNASSCAMLAALQLLDARCDVASVALRGKRATVTGLRETAQVGEDQWAFEPVIKIRCKRVGKVWTLHNR